MRNVQGLEEANRQRSESAATGLVRRASYAMSAIRTQPADRWRDRQVQARFLTAVTIRVQFPDRSLKQCAAVMGLSKDEYSSLLRRALTYAEKVCA
jgi:DNA-binding transcriptional regulator WhiA